MTFWFGKAKQMWYLTDFSSSDRLTLYRQENHLSIYLPQNPACWDVNIMHFTGKFESIHTHNTIRKLEKPQHLNTQNLTSISTIRYLAIVSSNKFSLLINDSWVKCYKHVIYSKTVDTENIKQHKSSVENCSKRQRESTMLMNSIWYSWNKITLYNNNIKKINNLRMEWKTVTSTKMYCIQFVSIFFSLFFGSMWISRFFQSFVYFFYFWNDWFFFGVSKFRFDVHLIFRWVTIWTVDVLPLTFSTQLLS